MKIKNINYSSKNNKSVLSAQIILNSGKIHPIYFEVDKEFEDFVSKDANSFITAALPIAMQKKENLEIDGITSKKLIRNTPGIMDILKNWKLGFNPILIKSNIFSKNLKKYKNIGCFFSGGADSFYTYLKNKKNINYLIFAHGFDIDINDFELYNKIEKNIVNIANKENVKLIKVKTNIRETFEQYFDWDLSHAFALASVALFLGDGLKEIYASCGVSKKNTHGFMVPELDYLWSTENMKINHYGCDADKISKLEFLSNHKVAMDNLRVCWVNKKREYNCSECEKCFRNMLALYSTHSLEKCNTFSKEFNYEKLMNMRLSESSMRHYVAALEKLELKKDTSKVRFALEESIRNNKIPKLKQRLYRKSRDSIRYFDKKYNRNRLYWFLTKKNFI